MGMGCSSSKEAEALSSSGGGTTTNNSSRDIKVKAEESARITTPRNSNSNSSNQDQNKEKEQDKKKEKEKDLDNGVAKPLKLVQLNDIVPTNTDVGNNSGDGVNFGRVLSYASGASTPSTSHEKLDWSGGDHTSDGGTLAETKSVDTAGTGSTNGSGMGMGMKKNKMYKHKHTGSAIDLENMFTEQKCTSLSSKVIHIEVPFGRPIEEVYDGVHDGPILGSGVSGIVRKVVHLKTGVEYAVKCLDLGLVGTEEGLEQLRDEIFIMCQLGM